MRDPQRQRARDGGFEILLAGGRDGIVLIPRLLEAHCATGEDGQRKAGAAKAAVKHGVYDIGFRFKVNNTGLGLPERVCFILVKRPGLVPLAETLLFAAQPVRERPKHWLQTAAASGTNSDGLSQ